MKVKDIAQKLAEGNLEVELTTSTQNEIGELAFYIGKTVERLKEYIVIYLLLMLLEENILHTPFKVLKAYSILLVL